MFKKVFKYLLNPNLSTIQRRFRSIILWKLSINNFEHKKNGVFCVIIPKKSQEYICTIAKEYKLFYNRVCYVKGNKSSKVKRVLMEFSFIKSVFKKEHLVIEKSRHEYTDQYVHLCQKFYLNM